MIKTRVLVFLTIVSKQVSFS